MWLRPTGSTIVRKITPAGVISTFAGSGTEGSADGIGTDSATFFNPAGITADTFGNLYVADSFNNKIRKIAVSGYTIDKPLPPGLNFDPTTGNISGTPTAASPATNYTVTAYNAGGGGAIINDFSCGTVTALAAPNISYQSPQTYTVNVPITPISPTNTGGAVPATIYGLVSTYAGTSAQGAPKRANQTRLPLRPVGLALVFDAFRKFICFRSVE